MNKHSLYYKQVQLLIDTLPAVANEECFALKGGTAIKLFIREPDWSLAPYPAVEQLPAVRWKLKNLEKMSDRNHAKALDNLKAKLERIFPKN